MLETEDQNADLNTDSKDSGHDVSNENKDSIRVWTQGQSKNLSIFYPKSLREAEFNGNGLFNLAEKISRQLSIQAVAWVLLDSSAGFTVRIGNKAQSRKT
jgi:hypothetical protein